MMIFLRVQLVLGCLCLATMDVDLLTTTTTSTDGQTTSTIADANKSSNVECARLTFGLDFLSSTNNVHKISSESYSSHLDNHQT